MGGISVCCGRLFMSCPNGDEEATRNLAPLLVPTSPVLAEKSPALTEEKFSPSSLSFAVRAVPAWDVNKGWILSQFTSLTNVGFHYCLGIKHFLKCKFLSCKESHLKKKKVYSKRNCLNQRLIGCQIMGLCNSLITACFAFFTRGK